MKQSQINHEGYGNREMQHDGFVSSLDTCEDAISKGQVWAEKADQNTGLSRRGFVSACAGILGMGALSMSALGCSVGKPNGNQSSVQQTGIAKDGTYPASDIAGKLSMAEFKQSAAEAESIKAHDSEETYDVVVVGAGASGLASALSAAEAGAKVCLLQKEMGTNSQGASMAYLDLTQTSKTAQARLCHLMRELGEYRSKWELNYEWTQRSQEAITWFADHLIKAGYQEKKDYMHFPIKKFPFDEGVAHLNCYILPGNVGGAVQTAYEANKDKVTAKFKTPAVQLIKDGDKVVGVYARTEDGKVLRVNANKGVILATGDYQNNEAMVNKYVPDAAPFDRKQLNKTGDGHLMGLMAGARMQLLGHTKMVHSSNAPGNSRIMQSGTMLAVNAAGERFCAEDMMFCVRNNVARNQPEGRWISILDSQDPAPYQALEEPDQRQKDLSQLDAATPEKGVFKAQTLEELADALKIPRDTFLKSVERYNSLCEQGFDEDFGKPKEMMIPVKTAPFYAINRKFAIAALTSGLEVNKNQQVLSEDMKPIEGLYAVGNCSGPFFGSPDYPMDIPGLSVSRAITSGYIAGKLVAGL